MKNLLFLLFTLTNLTLSAQQIDGNYSKYVWASKLNMRDAPNMNGKVIGQIPWGSIVPILEKNPNSTIDTIELTIDYGTGSTKFIEGKGNVEITTPRDFKIWGKWIKIRFLEKEGYVFDGFLSSIPPPKENESNVYPFKDYTEYFKREFGPNTKKHYGSRGDDDDYDQFQSWDGTHKYEIGIKGKGGVSNFYFSNISMTEGRLIGFQLFKDRIYWMCDFEVYEKDGYIVISYMCSC